MTTVQAIPGPRSCVPISRGAGWCKGRQSFQCMARPENFVHGSDDPEDAEVAGKGSPGIFRARVDSDFFSRESLARQESTGRMKKFWRCAHASLRR